MWILSFGPLAVIAQKPDDVPPLLEPLAEIPPTFWEQYGWLVIVGIVLLMALVGWLIWFLMRPKPVVPESIEVLTRRELELLQCEPANDRTLSRVSQCIRRYFTGRFELPPGEMTTSEFSRLLLVNEKVGAELAAAVVEFLRRADAAKFSPSGADAQKHEFQSQLQQARELFERGERRYVELQSAVAK